MSTGPTRTPRPTDVTGGGHRDLQATPLPDAVRRLADGLSHQGASAVDEALSRPSALTVSDSASDLANAQSFDVDLPDGHLWHIAVTPTWHAVDQEFEWGTGYWLSVPPDQPNPPFMQLATRITFGGAELSDQRLGGGAYGSDGAYNYSVTGIAWSSFRVRCTALPPDGFPDITYDVTIKAKWIRALVNGE